MPCIDQPEHYGVQDSGISDSEGAEYEILSRQVSLEEQSGRTVASGHRSVYLGFGQ
jgi:hypothetical protein